MDLDPLLRAISRITNEKTVLYQSRSSTKEVNRQHGTKSERLLVCAVSQQSVVINSDNYLGERD